MTEENSTEEQTLLEVSPAMFRAHPIWFLVCIVLIVFYGLGLVPLFLWWLSNKGMKLTVTTKRTTMRKGLIAKHTTEVWHRDVRNLQIHQGILQRMLGVGTIAVSSAGQSDVEIAFVGIKDPESVKQIIDQYR